MPYCTDERLLERHPEVSVVAAATREIALGDAGTELDEELAGLLLEQAHALLTMHKLALSPGSGLAPVAPSSGPVVSRRAGEISVSYAAPSSSGAGVTNGPHSNTSYGQRFDTLLDKIPHIPIAV